ncbi:MAG: sulfatase-like hydrolase/transferase [Chloroflexi bacterium]|nr:sulfatase-like hydrolase/transferase [Chloroflexota bacterium]
MADRRPNILWYCADQMRFDAIGALGNPHAHTPNLDRLVGEGVAFTSAYCQAPICTPSRASFLTGKYPSTIHVNTNGNGYFPRQETLVTRRLADAGYDCGLVGKLHLAGAANGREPRVDDGYRYFQYSHAPRDNWSRGHDYADWLREQGVEPSAVLTVKSNLFGDLMEPSPEQDNVPPHLHQTTWCTEKALEFIGEPRDGPWLLSVNPYDPHPPYNPPWEYYRRFDPDALPGPHFRESDLAHQAKLAAIDFQTRPRRPEEIGAKKIQAAYYAMVEQIDEQLGRLVDHLDRTGERQNTVILFSTDHGEALGDHGLTQKGCRFFDGLSRVPLIWSWPERFASDLRSDALVELTDVAPTLLELAGLRIPDETQGRSLRPILVGEAPPDHHREFVRSECYDAFNRPDRTFGTMYRDRRWKLIIYHGHEIGELYDMERDPFEFDSLWDDPEHQAIKLELLRKSFDATVRAMEYGPRRVMPY